VFLPLRIHTLLELQPWGNAKPSRAFLHLPLKEAPALDIRGFRASTGEALARELPSNRAREFNAPRTRLIFQNGEGPGIG
jgi:hypothetical protein